MPLYSYFAKSLDGKEKEGTLEAKNEKELAEILRREGYILIFAISKEKEKKPKISLSFFQRKISLKEKLFFVRNLQVMISAGISIPKALNSLAEQTKNKRFKKILLNLAEEITKGRNFSEAILSFPDVFSEFFQNMIKVGEETGNLENVLLKIAEQMEREYELKNRVIGALIYPAVILTFMVLEGIFMLAFVVPKLSQTFKELGVSLPFTTKIVISLGDFFGKYWYFLLLFVFLIFFLFQFLKKTEGFKKFIDKIFLSLPIISPIVKNLNSAFFARSLSTLFSSGVPIVNSLEITSNTLDNFYFKSVLRGGIERIKKGEKLSQILKNYPNIFPQTVIEMMVVGEETGQTAEVLGKLADFFEEEVTNATKNLVSVIEPLIMILVGAVVGFFAVSMVQPMYSMMQTIK
jgi:type IV pilus assembly protein PilC